MLANTADTGTLEYNTADGTLWFVHALGRHVAVTGDEDLGAELAPALEEIVDRHLAGTRFGIGVDADGLLRQGEDRLGADVDGCACRRRAGDAAHGQGGGGERALDRGARDRRAARSDRPVAAVHEAARASFVDRFPRADGRGLLDVVDGPGGDDPSVRPNQLLAVSLPGGPASAGEARSAELARATVEACAPLLTPLGLRSLAPDDPAYRAHHRGSPAERDAAYHQGTVWPWLIGPFVDAARRVGAATDELTDGLVAHLGEWGLGSVSETADGAAPACGDGLPLPGVVGGRGAARPADVPVRSSL